MSHWISAQDHQRWIDKEPKRMSIERYEAMLEMCKKHGQCTQEEIDAMQEQINKMKLDLWKA